MVITERRRLVFLAALVFLWSTSLGASRQDALAVDCDTEEAIFVGNYNTSTGSWILNYGSHNKIKLSNRDVNPSCTGTLAGSTSHVRLGGATRNWVEGGWRKTYSLTGGTKHYAFTEWGLNGTNVQKLNIFTSPCTLVVDNYQWWKTANILGSTDWKMYVKCGSTQHLMDTFTGLGWSKGISMGETFRFGGEQTGMATNMPELEKKGSNGAWVGWSWPQCYDDWASNWEPTANWTNNFDIVKGPSNC